MSITAQSPTLGYKRPFSDSDSPDTSGQFNKRCRQTRKPRSPKSGKKGYKQIVSREFIVSTLKSLYPTMEETAVVSVLESCGYDMNEAIRQLGLLQLTTSSSSEAAPANKQPLQSEPASSEAQDEARAKTEAELANAKPDDVVKTPLEWVDGLVNQMASAKDIADARGRAANELRAFEQAVMKSTNKARQNDLNAAQTRIADLTKENTMLKRAINIQQTRLQEAINVNKQQSHQAETALRDLQAKVHGLEMTNYSLSMHLKQATGSQSFQHHPPDVY